MKVKAVIFLASALFCKIIGLGQENSELNVGFRTGNSYTSIKGFILDNGYKHKTAEIPDGQVYFFHQLSGPSAPSIIKAGKKSSWKDYTGGGQNRLCVYLIDTLSYWPGLVNGLQASSIPFTVTNDLTIALRYQVIMIYPDLTSKSLQLSGFKKIRDYLRQGGTLICFNPASTSISGLLGFESSIKGTNRNRIIMNNRSSPVVSFCQEFSEREINIGSQDTSKPAFETTGFINPDARPLAVYNDGTAAIIRKIYDRGTAYAFGLDLGLFTSLCLSNRDADYQSRKINSFEPTLDVLYRIIRNIFRLHCNMPVMAGMVPDGKKISILMTHDLTGKTSMDNAMPFALLEKESGIKATYFIQAKYISDQQGPAFLTNENRPVLDSLKMLGMELASRGVTQTPFYDYMPLGSGEESYPDYRPYFVSTLSTLNESVLGEVRVSKFLIDRIAANQTRTFRSGYLDYTDRLYPALKAADYQYSSSVPANQVLTHLPFQAFNKTDPGTVYGIYELPITILDEGTPDLNERLGQAVFITDQVAKYGGLVIISISPENAGGNFDFFSSYIDQYSEDAWFGTVTEFGDWWSAKNLLSINGIRKDELLYFSITAPKPIRNLPLILPAGMQVIEKSPFNLKVRPYSDGIIIDYLAGTVKMTLGF